jgi:hypothetical protein
VAQADPHDALVDFLMGTVRLVPRFGNVFKKSDSLQFVAFGYNATAAPGGKPSLTARFEVYKGDKLASGGANVPIDTVDFVPVVGPVPLGTVEPGQYRLQVVAIDNVAQKEQKASVTYEVVP